MLVYCAANLCVRKWPHVMAGRSWGLGDGVKEKTGANWDTSTVEMALVITPLIFTL